MQRGVTHQQPTVTDWFLLVLIFGAVWGQYPLLHLQSKGHDVLLVPLCLREMGSVTISGKKQEVFTLEPLIFISIPDALEKLRNSPLPTGSGFLTQLCRISGKGGEPDMTFAAKMVLHPSASSSSGASAAMLAIANVITSQQLCRPRILSCAMNLIQNRSKKLTTNTRTYLVPS